jgi:membrane fusion protein (multidrug efflux system)
MSEKSPENRTIKKSRGRFRRIAPKVVLIIVAIGILTLIGKLPKRNGDSAPMEAAPINVEVMTIAAEPEFAETFDLPAVVEPNRVVTISAEIDGRIEQIPSAEGSRVQEGDLLVQLNTDLLQPQFESSEAQFKRDQIEFERMKGLVEADATSRSDLDNATTQLSISKAQLEQARARLERSHIIAPVSGILNNIPVEEGEYVQSGNPVAEIVNTDTVKVVVDVPERDISFFTLGGNAEVSLNYKGCEKTMEGTITFISELANQQTRSTSMEITLSNEKGFLRSGQIVHVHLTRRMLKNAILIPLQAVIPMENGYAVYVANSDQAQRHNVELGVIKADIVQITSGLKPGEKLIIAGHRFVAPGQKVNVVKENK